MASLEVSAVIARSVEEVWDFFAVRHVENHPRWDPDLSLELVTERPIRVGSVIRRTSIRWGAQTEGTTTVTVYEPQQLMEVETTEGGSTFRGWTRFEAVEPTTTRITLGADIPGMDEAMAGAVLPLMERSASTIKALVEAET